jgi:hypothetical protein
VKIVRIEIHRGVPEIIAVPEGVRVVIRDFDTFEDEPYEDMACDGPMDEDATFREKP